jgi:hypothetical protein
MDFDVSVGSVARVGLPESPALHLGRSGGCFEKRRRTAAWEWRGEQKDPGFPGSGEYARDRAYP